MEKLYRWVSAYERLPTLKDYYNTFGIIYRNSNSYPSIKQSRSNFSVDYIKASSSFHEWLEIIPLSESPVTGGENLQWLIDMNTARESYVNKCFMKTIRPTDYDLWVKDYIRKFPPSEAVGGMEVKELIEALSENLELQLSMRGCQTESAALKSDADSMGGLELLQQARNYLSTLPTGDAEEGKEEKKVTPCGGCGNDNPASRCIGCKHNFYQ